MNWAAVVQLIHQVFKGLWRAREPLRAAESWASAGFYGLRLWFVSRRLRELLHLSAFATGGGAKSFSQVED